MTEILGKRGSPALLKDKTTKKIKDKTISEPQVNGSKKNKKHEEEEEVQEHVEPVTQKKSKKVVQEAEDDTNNIKIKISDKEKNAKKSQDASKKVHLAPEEVETRIKELQQRVEELAGPENANKRKRALQKLIQYKKALGNPEDRIVDPNEQKRKQEEDRERRVQKKIEKSNETKEKPLSQKKKHSYCIICKEKGHYAETCRQTKAKTHLKELEKHMCFNCGKTDHGLYACPEPRGKNLNFATCFFCKERGHLSRDCPKNEQGIYHKGGSCFECGSVRHLAKECPVRWGNNVKELDSVPKNKIISKKTNEPQEGDDYAEDVADDNDIFSDNEDDA